MNIKKIFISSSMSIINEYKEGNDEVRDAVNKYPDKLIGYITVNPNYEDGTLSEVLRLKDCKGFKGIKLHPDHNRVRVVDKRYEELFSYADKVHAIILVHTWNSSAVADMECVIKKYPNANFIIAHAGNITGTEPTARIIKEYPNAYCDFPVSSAKEGVIEYLVKNGDSNKILFGTDSPLFDHRISYGRLLFANISDEDKIKIFGQNLKKLLSESSL